MKRSRHYLPVKVTLTLGREPEHLLRRVFWRKGLLQTACGMAPYTDGLGREIRSVRDGRKVHLKCKFCRDHLYSLIYGRGFPHQGELFE